MSTQHTLSEKIARYKYWILAVLLGLFSLAFYIWHAQSNLAKKETGKTEANTTQPKAALTVSVVEPEQRQWQQQFSANGNIAAWQEVVIGSELAGQRISKVNVNIGDQVQRGQVLAEINSDSIRAELASANANLKEAQAVLADATLHNQRIQQLKNTGAISKQEASQYQTSQSTAQARLDAARAQIESNQLRLAQTQVRSPDNGVISARAATVGSLAQNGQELFRLIRDYRLEWRAEVTSTDLYKLKPGMQAQVYSPDPTVPPVIGTVRMIAPVIDPQTRYGLVYVDLPNTQAVRMGMYLKGQFQLGEKSALTIPQTALLLRDGFSYVFAVDSKMRVKQYKVTVGRRVDNRVEILDLPANLKLVASGAGFLTDGDLVKIAANIPDTPLTKQLLPEQGK